MIVWFRGTDDQQRQLLNRLVAEWPWSLEVIDPIEPGDQWGARLARYPEHIGQNPHAEFEVGERYVELPSLDEIFSRR